MLCGRLNNMHTDAGFPWLPSICSWASCFISTALVIRNVFPKHCGTAVNTTALALAQSAGLLALYIVEHTPITSDLRTPKLATIMLIPS